MERAVDGGAAAEPGALVAAPAALAAVTFVIVGAALFFGGGAESDSIFWIGTAVALLAAFAAAGTVLGPLPRPEVGRSGVAFLALLAALAVWSGLSIQWSLSPARSWDYVNRELVYLGFALLGVYAGAIGRGSVRWVAGGLAVLFAAVVGWALLGKVDASLVPDYERIARLREPVGYWNALALVGDMALPLGLWIASSRERLVVARVAGVLLLYGALLMMLLTYSRGGLVVGAVVCGAWMVFVRRERLESLAALAIATPPALLVFAWAHTRHGLTRDQQPLSARTDDGRLFLIAALLGAVVVLWVSIEAARRERERPVSRAFARSFVRFVAGGAAGLAVGVLLVSLVSAGGPSDWVRARWHEFSSPAPLQETPGRLGSFSSNSRWTWWGESWDAWQSKPLHGNGAGSFRLLHRPRFNGDSVLEPHDLPVQLLAETGLVGFALWLGAVVAALVVGWRALRRLDCDERAAAVALATGALAYLLHVLIDFDWDFVAVTAPVAVVVGVLASPGRARSPVGRPTVAAGVWAAGVLAVALGVVYALAAPWLSVQRVNASIDAIGRGDARTSLRAAKEAHSLNPLALDPLWLQAATLASQHRLLPARKLYLDAVSLEPKNAETWFELGAFDLRTYGDARAAYNELNRSYTLNPFGPAGEPCGPLDQARAELEQKKLSCRAPQPRARP
jgi:O-Antigen ligase